MPISHGSQHRFCNMALHLTGGTKKVHIWRSEGGEKIPIYDDIHSFPGSAKRGGCTARVSWRLARVTYMVGLMLCIFGFLRAESGQDMATNMVPANALLEKLATAFFFFIPLAGLLGQGSRNPLSMWSRRRS